MPSIPRRADTPAAHIRVVQPRRPPSDSAAFARHDCLPRPLTSLIGREAEAAAACALLRGGVRLLTLTGPGGVGKTRLAIRIGTHAAAVFPDGVVFVSLAPIADPELVLPTIARALDIRESSERPVLEVIANRLQNQNTLLILDNLEHLLAAAPALSSLLTTCPNLTVLATSRGLLNLSGEHTFPVSPLTLPKYTEDTSRPGFSPARLLGSSEAVQLFVERARGAQAGFALTADNAEAVVAMCRQLDGLPLAIELAAAWVRVLPPAALLTRLEQRLPLLRDGAADQPPRLRSMRDAIAWSYDLLSDDEARLFRRLAVFVGGFTLEGVEWVAGDSPLPWRGARGGEGLRVAGELDPRPQPATLDLVAGLADKSLLQRIEAGADEPRYRMLETVREFALERLAEHGESENIAAAHAAFIAGMVEKAEPHLLGPEERRWRARLDAELGNLRAALTWSLEHDVETALRIGAALWVHWSWNQVAEGTRWLSVMLKRSSREPDLLRARALTTHAALAVLAGDVASGSASAGLAIALAAAAGDPIAEGLARWIVAAGYAYDASVSPAVQELERALALLAGATTTKDRAQAAYARWTLGHVQFMLGDREQAILLYEEALAQVRNAGSGVLAMIILSDFAGCLLDLGNPGRAREMLHEAMSLAIHYGESVQEIASLPVLALVDALEGAAVPAARLLGATEAVRIRTGMAIPLQFQQRINRATALAKDMLGEESFAMAWEAGHADPQIVIAEAIGLTPAGDAPTGIRAAEGVGLSPREHEVLRLLADGLADKEIAVILGISRRTASKHVATILAKMGVESRTAAVAKALRLELL